MHTNNYIGYRYIYLEILIRGVFMFEKDKIAIGISQTNIKIMVGNRNVVRFQDIIKTPEGSFNDDKIVELEDIKNTLHNYIKSKDIKTKKVCFSIQGLIAY